MCMPWGKGLRTPGCTGAQPHSFNGSYSFIKPDSGDSDIFAHVSELQDGNIYPGDRVSFDIAPDTFKPGKMCARQVRRVE